MCQCSDTSRSPAPLQLIILPTQAAKLIFPRALLAIGKQLSARFQRLRRAHLDVSQIRDRDDQRLSRAGVDDRRATGHGSVQ
jgi:hypothetical protein